MEHQLLSEELKLLKKTVKSFIKQHVIPAELAADTTAEMLPVSVVEQLQETAKKAGLWRLGTSADLGGAGLNLFEQAVVWEEAVQHRFGFYYPGAHAFGSDLPSLLTKCTADVKETYINEATDTNSGCFMAIWERQESNDLDHLQCLAYRQDSKWVINGEKTFITNQGTAKIGVVLVNCITDDNQKQPTLFLLTSDDEFIKKSQFALDVHSSYSLEFENLVLDDNRRIGEIGEGRQLVEQWMLESQVLLASRCIGIAQKALEIGVEYASLRITRGKPLSHFPTIRSMLAESAIEIQAARMLVWDAALKINERKEDYITAVKSAKWMATLIASKAVDKVFQIHGGAGFTRDVPLERWYKELRISRLELESSEKLLEYIAEDLIS